MESSLADDTKINLIYVWVFSMTQQVKNPPAKAGDTGTWVWFLSQEDTSEEEMATHASILAWKIPWTEEPGRL